MSCWDIYLRFTSIDIVLYVELVLKSLTHLQKKAYYKSATIDGDILGIRIET